MSIITQCWASTTMEKHFADDLRKKWGLTKYEDPTKPALFFGYYEGKDYEVMSKHKSDIVMLWGGVDLRPERVLAVDKLGAHQIAYGWQKPIFDNLKVKYKEVVIPIKNFDKFKPVALGDKVYLYRGWLVPKNRYFHWENLINPLFKVFGENKFIYDIDKDINYIHENLYKKSFLYLKPNPKGGSTTMWELGHMGIKTLANHQGQAPNVIPYRNINDIIKTIETESKKIGTVQDNLADSVRKYLDMDNRWLDINFYK